MSDVREIVVPKFYRPWPHQVAAWKRRDQNRYNFYFKVWARQLGKDTDAIQYALWRAWNNPGTQSAYVGLNNVWVSNNIFKKYIDGRTHWQDYPDDKITHNDTQKEVYLYNNPEGLAPARLKFIGFLQDSPLIGSSYDNFYISEMGLYRAGAFDYVDPIWQRKLAEGSPLYVEPNGTPRGMRNTFYDMLKSLTGKEDPMDFPGEHGNVYVDKKTIHDVFIPDADAPGKVRRLFSDEYIEELKDRMMRQFGNLNLYRQEYECDFLTVNAGLVYQGIEQLMKDGRWCKISADMNRPIYMAWDIANKADERKKPRDANAAIIFQYYNGSAKIIDWYESRGLALAECINELRMRPYFHGITMGILPWDAGLDKTTKGLRQELEEMFPNIMWHLLGQNSVQRGIEMGWGLFPNLIINSLKCDRVLDCFLHYEYRRNEFTGTWDAPRRSEWLHLMDAFRYMAMGIHEIDYLQLNNDKRDDDGSWYYGGEEVGGWIESSKGSDLYVPRTYRKQGANEMVGDVYG